MDNIKRIIFNLTEIELAGIAKLGDDKYLDYLVDSWSYLARMEVAKHKKDKYLDKLRYDKDFYVLREVAKHGRPQDLDVLFNSKYISVLHEVAKHGRPQDLDVLINVRDFRILRDVAKHGRPQDLDVIMSFTKNNLIMIEDEMSGYHEDWVVLYRIDKVTYADVLREVAKHGRPQDLEKIKNSPYGAKIFKEDGTIKYGR